MRTKTLTAMTAVFALIGGTAALAQDAGGNPVGNAATQDAPVDARTEVLREEVPAVGMSATEPDTLSPNEFGNRSVYIDGADGRMSSENLIGVAVYSRDRERIGDVRDIVYGTGGSVDAVVVGVEEAVGTGDKAVSVSIGQLSRVQPAEGDAYLIADGGTAPFESAPTITTQ